MSLNRVVLVGRLTRDPEPRTTSTGKSLVNFSIAVDKRIKPQDGSPTADFFNCSAWGSTADFVVNYLGKGRLIAVDGRLSTRKFTTQDGQNREVYEIVADNVQGLDRPRDDGGAPRSGGGSMGSSGGPSSGPASYDDDDPFADE